MRMMRRSWWRVLLWVFLIALAWWTFTVAGEVARTTKEGSEPAKIEGRAAQEAEKEAREAKPARPVVSFKRTYHPSREELRRMAKVRQANINRARHSLEPGD